MQVIYEDKRILVAVKPAGVVSVDEPGGMPSLVRQYLGDDKACVRTVHRLDQTVSGLMVFARSRAAASILSEQIRNGGFHKSYLAAVHGVPAQSEGELRDLLYYNRQERMSHVMPAPGKDVQQAVLTYRVLAQTEDGQSLLRIQLETGRTHQIRVQLSSRGWPIIGDRKYGREDARQGDGSSVLSQISAATQTGIRAASYEATAPKAAGEGAASTLQLNAGDGSLSYDTAAARAAGEGAASASQPAQIALWSCALSFAHPETGETMHFYLRPPELFPWTAFPDAAFSSVNGDSPF